MKTAGLIAGPLLALLVFALNPGDNPPEARRLLGIVVMAICFWMTEAILLPATALLASSLAIVTGVAPASEVLAPYANPVIFLFTGTFLLAEAFATYRLDRTLVAAILREGRGSSAAGLMAGFGSAAAAISTVISNTATAALVTPLAVGAVEQRGGIEVSADGRSRRGRPWASSVMLMIAYGATVGGMATIIGTPPNLLVAGFLDELAGVRVSFTAWLIFGVPVAVSVLLASYVLTRLMTEAAALSPVATHEARDSAKKDEELSPREIRNGARWTLFAFALAGFLWTLPAIAGLVVGRDAPAARLLERLLPEAGVALLCASLLFVMPVRWASRRFALSWEEGRRVNWGIILLFGGGLSLGSLAQSTGLAAKAGEVIHGTGLAESPAGFLAVCIVVSILISEFASNTAATTLIVPIVIAAAHAVGHDPVRPALGAGLAATCGFIFPVSTPPNAIVFATGLVPLWKMIRVGLLLDLAAGALIWLWLIALTPLLPH